MAIRNVFLVGPMGAGKTTVGRRLAQSLGWDFFDSDEEVERRTGTRISIIFEIEGEAGFRQREHRALLDLAARPGAVIATGGEPCCCRRIGSFCAATVSWSICVRRLPSSCGVRAIRPIVPC